MIASASATVEDLGPWFGALRFRYFGRRSLIEDNSVTSKPTTLVDLRVGYRFSEQARLWLDILNLFNNTGAHQISPEPGLPEQPTSPPSGDVYPTRNL